MHPYTIHSLAQARTADLMREAAERHLAAQTPRRTRTPRPAFLAALRPAHATRPVEACCAA